MSRIGLFKHFVKKPGEIGAVCPSSKALAETIIKDIEIEKAGTVVEIGPGTGVFTDEIIKKVGDNTHFFVIELNEQLHADFQKKYPDIAAYNNCASELESIMKEEKASAIDVIVSGLPWAAFPTELQNDIMDAILKALKPGGYFTTFAYLQGFLMPGAHRFRALLESKFDSVEKSNIVWRNFPPAFVYRCRKKQSS